jgi:hypothetical protein
VEATVTSLPQADVEWLQAQYRQAWRAAAHARGGRRGARNPLDLCHVSATARMVALGETMLRLGVPVPTSAREPHNLNSEVSR